MPSALSRLRSPAPILGALLLAGCTADAYERQADRAVAEILSEGTDRTLGGRRESVIRPRSQPAEPAPPSKPPANPHGGEPGGAGAPAPPAEELEVLTLTQALEI